MRVRIRMSGDYQLSYISYRRHERKIFSKIPIPIPIKVNHTIDTHRINLKYRNRHRSLPINSKADTLTIAPVRTAISDSVFSDRFATPFLAVDAFDVECGYVFHSFSRHFVRSPSVRSGTLASNFTVRRYFTTTSSVIETHAIEQQTRQRNKHGAELWNGKGGKERERKADFQMDINSSACSTP